MEAYSIPNESMQKTLLVRERGQSESQQMRGTLVKGFLATGAGKNMTAPCKKVKVDPHIICKN